MTISIGLIGSGIVTQKAHIPALFRDNRFTITGICRRETSKLRTIKDQLRHASIFTNYSDMMTSGEVDCVLVAADVDVHLTIVQEALDNDIGCLVEKPVDSSADRIDEFIRGNEQKDLDRKVMVAFNKRFYPGVVRFNELRKNDEISRIIGGSIDFLTKQGRKGGKPGILQNLIHTCDLICHIFGETRKVSSQFSEVLNDEQKGKTISSSIKTESGSVVNMFFSSSSNWNIPVHERLELIDDRGSKYLVVDNDRIYFSKVLADGSVENRYFRESNSIFWKYNAFGYEAQISAFGDMVQGERNETWPTLLDALRAQRLFERIFEDDK